MFRPFTLFTIVVLLFSCKKENSNEPQPINNGSTGPTGITGITGQINQSFIDSFYVLPRNVIYRDDCDSLGNWTVSYKQSELGLTMHVPDTSKFYITNGSFTLEPDWLSPDGIDSISYLIGNREFPNIQNSTDTIAIEIAFNKFNYYDDSYAGFTFGINQKKWKANGMWLKDSDYSGKSLHFLVIKDSLQNFQLTPGQWFDGPCIKSPLTGLPTSDCYFQNSSDTRTSVFFDFQCSRDNLGCTTRKSIVKVDYIEVYTY